MAKQSGGKVSFEQIAADISAKLRNGTKLDVTYEPTQNEGNEPVRLVSSYEASEGGALFLISAPLQGELMYPLRPDDRVALRYADRNALFSFDVIVRDRVRQDNLSLLRVELCSEIRRTQRRQDFRLSISMQGVIERFDPVLNKAKGYAVLITDLSGGGAAIQGDLKFEIGEKTRIYIPIDGTTIAHEVEVRRCARIENPDALYHYALGLRFLFQSEKEKDVMIGHIFRLQRQVKKISS